MSPTCGTRSSTPVGPRAFSVALSVLGTRVNADRGGPFSVLLRGEGPEPAGVARLD
jgi:hypothetical protein